MHIVHHAPSRILITGVGGAAGIGLLRTLGAEAQELYAADMDSHATGLYLVPTERRLLVPRGDDPSFVPVLLDLCRRLAIDVLVPTVDVELLPVARAARAFADLGIRLVLAPESTLSTCLDKLQLFQACDGWVPQARYACFDERFDATGFTFPVILKPRSGSGGRGVQLVRTREELLALPRDPALLVQEYLPGAEYSVDVFADAEGEVLAAVPRERLKVDSGVAVAARTLRDPELERLATVVAQRIGLRYVANVQFRRGADGVPALLEVNARFPGTMALTVASGVNMPLLAVQEALGLPRAKGPLRFSELGMVRYWEELFVEPRALREMARRRDSLLGSVAHRDVA